MPGYKLPKTSLEHRMQGTQTNKSKIFLSSWMLDIMKWFKRWVEISGDAMKHVISKDRLLEALRMKW